MTWRTIRIPLLVALLLYGGWTATRSFQRVQQIRAAGAACDALAAGDPARTLELSAHLADVEPNDSISESALEMAECRCFALIASGNEQQCTTEIADLLVHPDAADWLPEPVLAAAAIDELEARRQFDEALSLVQRSIEQWPTSPLFRSREFRLRSAEEDELALLEEFRNRLEADVAAGRTIQPDLPLLLSSRYADRRQWDDAIDVLGETPPNDPSLTLDWWNLKTRAIAGLGDTARLEAAFRRWSESGGPPAEITARRAVLLVERGLERDADRAIQGLRDAIRVEDQVSDVGIRRNARLLLIRSLAYIERYEEALDLYDETAQIYADVGNLSREEIVRLAEEQDHEISSFAQGRLRFSGLESGDRLVLPPDPWSDGSAQFVLHPAGSSGDLQVQRAVGDRPIWWAVLDARGTVRAEGTTRVPYDSVQVIDIERREPPAPASWVAGERPPADGRRRVLQLVFDSWDWRLVNYLRATGRLPTADSLIRDGLSGSLVSEPPFTAAALQALVEPSQGSFSVLQLVHQLGEETESLNFIGRNPVKALEDWLPDSENLFEVIGAAPLKTVNLLQSLGSLNAGRNATVFGPEGERSELFGYAASRPLDEQELEEIPELDRDFSDRQLLFNEAAADFDNLERILREGEIDLVVARIASLDLMTHGSFGRFSETRQREETADLLLFYQYLDLRLSELISLLDGDDVLILMSDHGTLTSLEHDPQAVFVIAGSGLPTGQLALRPDIREVSRVVADLMGVETDWPGAAFSAALGLR